MPSSYERLNCFFYLYCSIGQTVNKPYTRYNHVILLDLIYQYSLLFLLYNDFHLFLRLYHLSFLLQYIMSLLYHCNTCTGHASIHIPSAIQESQSTPTKVSMNSRGDILILRFCMILNCSWDEDSA